MNPQCIYALHDNTTANRELAKSENPGASIGDIGKVLGAMWAGLSKEEKQTWTDAAAAARGNTGVETESSEDEGNGDSKQNGTDDVAEPQNKNDIEA